MNDDNAKIRITKIINLPGENGNIPEIDCDFSIELARNSYFITIKEGTESSKKNDFSDQIKNKNIKDREIYHCPILLAIDYMGKQYTIYNFSYVCFDDVYRQYIEFCFEGILIGGHLNDELLKQKFDRVETEVKYKPQIRRFESTFGSIHSVIEPIYIRYKNDEVLKEFLGTNEISQFANKLKISLDGRKTFAEIKDRLWRLSEFMFLCYEDMFFYDTLSVYIGENLYELRHYLHANNAKTRKRDLRTKNSRCNAFCMKAFNETDFTSFLDFRKDSDIIFDVFRTTVYSNTFREDYPLRLSQTLEGLANHLDIVDTKNYDDFYAAILHSLANNDFINFTHREAQDFCKSIREHRHKFSHVKKEGSYLKGEENEKFAEILYTTIRVLIIRRIRGEI